MDQARLLIGQAARATSIVGASAVAIFGSGWLFGVEAATVAAIIVTITAGALFGAD